MPALHRALVPLALLLAACAAPAVPPTAEPPPAVVVTTPTATPAKGRPATAKPRAKPTPAEVPAALRFTATTVDGKPFDGATLAGKPVLLWFWAPWCPTCRGQVKQVQAIARDYRDQVQVVGVGSLDDAAAIRRFAADAGGLTHLSDADGAVFRHFEVTEQSSFVLLDARGAEVWSVGYGGSADLADRVASVAR